jgi:hypothetical protein
MLAPMSPNTRHHVSGLAGRDDEVRGAIGDDATGHVAKSLVRIHSVC